MSKTTIGSLYDRYIKAHNVEGLEIPMTAVKFYPEGKNIPSEVQECCPDEITLTSCQGTKQASLGDSVLLTRQNIGCVAAAISLGLVPENQDEPIQDSLVYTDIMREQSGLEDKFTPPSPKDFQEGTVYACAAAGRSEFALFGKEDAGRFKDVETSKKAIGEMVAVQNQVIKGVFLYSKDFEDIDVLPDVVILSVRPIELSRIIQGYWYNTGERLNASMGGLRMVNSDLMARPYLTGEINISTYCMGARLIAEFGPDRMGIGIPFDKFKTIVEGMEASQKGYPFQLYPGASQTN